MGCCSFALLSEREQNPPWTPQERAPSSLAPLQPRGTTESQDGLGWEGPEISPGSTPCAPRALPAVENATPAVPLPQILPPQSAVLTGAVFSCARAAPVAPSPSLDRPCEVPPSMPCCSGHPPAPPSPPEGAELLVFGTPRSERRGLVASPAVLETKIHFLFRESERRSALKCCGYPGYKQPALLGAAGAPSSGFLLF